MYRPTVRVMRTLIAPALRRVFPERPRGRLLCVFVRLGDKFKEAKPVAMAEYWRQIESLSARFNVSVVYLSSDSQWAIGNLSALAAGRTDLRVATLDYARLGEGMNQKFVVEKLWHNPAVEDLVRTMLADLVVAASAHVWLGEAAATLSADHNGKGTLSSNYCRLQNEMRCANGRFGTQYWSLDRDSHDLFND